MFQEYFRRVLSYLGAFLIIATTILAYPLSAKENGDKAGAIYLNLTLKDGVVKIKLFPNLAPKNVARIVELTKAGAYDGVAFHRVMSGFMAQTGDVRFGNVYKQYNRQFVGQGGSSLPDLPLEASSLPFKRGVVAMARAQAVNSANSQFFICYGDASWLFKQYTIIGEVVQGMQLVDKLKKGLDSDNGAVSEPDYIISAKIT